MLYQLRRRVIEENQGFSNPAGANKTCFGASDLSRPERFTFDPWMLRLTTLLQEKDARM